MDGDTYFDRRRAKIISHIKRVETGADIRVHKIQEVGNREIECKAIAVIVVEIPFLEVFRVPLPTVLPRVYRCLVIRSCISVPIVLLNPHGGKVSPKSENEGDLPVPSRIDLTCARQNGREKNSGCGRLRANDANAH